MQQPNAVSKGNNQTLYYRFLMFQRTRTLYNQTCSDTKPVAPRLKETETPHIPEDFTSIFGMEYGAFRFLRAGCHKAWYHSRSGCRVS